MKNIGDKIKNQTIVEIKDTRWGKMYKTNEHECYYECCICGDFVGQGESTSCDKYTCNNCVVDK